MRDTISMNGVTYGTTAADILSGNVTLGESLTASQLSVDTLSVEVTASAAPEGVYGDAVEYRRDGALFGRFYLTGLTRTGRRRWKIDAVSAVGLLDGVKHYGGVYDGQDASVSGAEAVIADIIGGAFSYTVTGFGDVRLYGWLPIASRRENLQQVLFAIGGNITKDTSGDVVISPLADTISDAVEKSETFLGGKVTYPVPASAVRVTEHAYVRGNETKEIFSGEIMAAAVTSPAGESLTGQLIEFREPYDDLACSGAQILASGANWAVLSASASAVLTGKPYVHSTKVVTVYAEDAAGGDYVPEVKDCTLVSLANSTNVAQRVLAYYGGFKRVEQDIVVTDQRPGDRVSFWDPYGERSGGYIKTLNLTLGALLRGSAVFETGYIPAGIGNAYKYCKIVTASGAETMPNANRARIVLIGGGSGGGGGYPGEAGKQPEVHESSTQSTAYKTRVVSNSGGAWPATLSDDDGSLGDDAWAYANQWYKTAPSPTLVNLGGGQYGPGYIYPKQTYADYLRSSSSATGIDWDHIKVYAGDAYNFGYYYRYKSKSQYYGSMQRGTSGGKNYILYLVFEAYEQTVTQGTKWAEYSGMTAGGAGGAGGISGAGGRVYQMDVECTPGETIQVTIGTGGAGGAAAIDETGGASPGDAGGATTVLFRSDLLSSENGTSTAYQDVINGVTYGGAGVDGTPGGAGGAASGYIDMSPGEGVGTYSGGGVNSAGTANTSGSGGGASATADGNSGNVASGTTLGSGGAGADADPPAAPTVYGMGGTGGNGGGGGGNAAGYDERTGNWSLADPAPGGAGSSGGPGAPGVVLIFYGDPVYEPPANALKDWYRQTMTDADGKTVTVTGGYRSKFSGWQIDDFIEEVLNG